MDIQPKDVQRYVRPDGKIPFDEWFYSLRDRSSRNKITARLDRLVQGNLGNYRSVGEGVCEFKVDYGPGYRIYFGQVGSRIVLLLCGGDKSTQEKDIRTAIEYWKDYRS